MSARARRAPTIALAAALLAGVTAAWLVNGYTKSFERRGGRPVAVLVAAATLKGGEPLDLRTVEASVQTRTMPRSYVAAGAFASPDELAGLRPLADLPPGTQLAPVLFAAPGRADAFKLRRGERAVTVGAGFSPDGEDPTPGRLVDLYAGGVGGGTAVETVVSGAEVLAVSDAPEAAATAEQAQSGAESSVISRPNARRLTLRVARRQAAALIRADAFAQDLRAVLRP